MFNLTVRTPQDDIYRGKAESLSFSTENGEMQILEDHASITATIIFSPITIVEKEGQEQFLGRNGIFLFNNETNSGTLLLAYCEKKSEISLKTIAEYQKFIEDQLAAGKHLSTSQILYLKNEKIAVEEQLEKIE